MTALQVCIKNSDGEPRKTIIITWKLWAQVMRSSPPTKPDFEQSDVHNLEQNWTETFHGIFISDNIEPPNLGGCCFALSNCGLTVLSGLAVPSSYQASIS